MTRAEIKHNGLRAEIRCTFFCVILTFSISGSAQETALGIQDPKKLETLNTFTARSDIEHILYDGAHTYVISYDNTSTLAVESLMLSEPGEFQFLDSVSLESTWSVPEPVIAGERIYLVSAQRVSASDRQGFLNIIDISDPENLVISTGSVPIGRLPKVFTVSGDLLFSVHPPDQNNTEWDALSIYDISDPSSPVLKGGHDSFGFIAEAVVEKDSVLLVGHKGGFTIFDVADPDDPQIIREFELEGQVTDILVEDELAYVTTDPPGTLRLIDITTPENPVTLRSFSVEGMESSSLYYISKSDKYLYGVGEHVIFVFDESPGGTFGLLNTLRTTDNYQLISGINVLLSGRGNTLHLLRPYEHASARLIVDKPKSEQLKIYRSSSLTTSTNWDLWKTVDSAETVVELLDDEFLPEGVAFYHAETAP